MNLLPKSLWAKNKRKITGILRCYNNNDIFIINPAKMIKIGRCCSGTEKGGVPVCIIHCCPAECFSKDDRNCTSAHFTEKFAAVFVVLKHISLSSCKNKQVVLLWPKHSIPGSSGRTAFCMLLKLFSSSTMIAERRRAKHTIGEAARPWCHDKTIERENATHSGTSNTCGPVKQFHKSEQKIKPQTHKPHRTHLLFCQKGAWSAFQE